MQAQGKTCLRLSLPKVFTVSSHSAGAPGTVTQRALPGGSSGPPMPRFLTSCSRMRLLAEDVQEKSPPN